VLLLVLLLQLLQPLLLVLPLVLVVVHVEVLPADQAVAQQAVVMLDQFQQSTPLTRSTRTVDVAAVMAGRFGRRSG
jgi:hypothetical protein